MSRTLSLELVSTPGVDQQEAVRAAAFSADGRFLATGGDDGAVRLWDASGSRLIRTFSARVEDDHPARVLAVAFGGGSRPVLAATSDTGRAFTWSPHDGQRLAVIVTGEQHVHSIAVGPDGSLLAAGVGDTVRLWDPWTGLPAPPSSRPQWSRAVGRVQPGRDAPRHGRRGRHRPALGMPA